MVENYVLITKENYAGFEGVLTSNLISGKQRVSLGSFDEDGNVLGAVSFTLLDYQYEVDWLYVEPKVRRSKIGTHLMDKVIATATETMETYPISVRYSCESIDEPLYEFFMFYDKMDVNYSHDRYIVTPKDIAESSYLHSKYGKKFDVRCFFDEKEGIRKNLLETLRISGGYVIEDYELWEEKCVKELCQCIYVDDKPCDLLFIQKNEENSLELSYMVSTNPTGLAYLMMSVAKIIGEKYPDCDLKFDAINAESDRLARKLFPKAKKVSVYEAEWW